MFKPQVTRVGDRIFINIGTTVPLSYSIDRALVLARDITMLAENATHNEQCGCGSGKIYGLCCLGSGL
jgi:hypothetical protein